MTTCHVAWQRDLGYAPHNTLVATVRKSFEVMCNFTIRLRLDEVEKVKNCISADSNRLTAAGSFSLDQRSAPSARVVNSVRHEWFQ